MCRAYTHQFTVLSNHCSVTTAPVTCAFEQCTYHTRPLFLVAAVTCVSSANPSTHLPRISPASGAANLSPELYVFEKERGGGFLSLDPKTKCTDWGILVWYQFRSGRYCDDILEWPMYISDFTFSRSSLTTFRRFRKIAKNDYWLRWEVRPSARLPVCPHGTAWLPLDRFSQNLVFECFSKIRADKSSFIKIW